MANQPTWVTSLGNNSVKIQYPAAAALADIMDTVETWLLAHGWALHDNAAGTNARAYRALNKDGTTYKYMVLDYNTSSHIFCKVYESWNATLNQFFTGAAHTGLNLCIYSDGVAYTNHIDLTNSGVLYICATAQWAYFQSSTVSEGIGSTTGNSGMGIFEITRDNPEDTVAAGYPCWGWMSLNLMMTSVNYVFTLPRVRDGGVGANAGFTFVSTIIGSGGLNILNTNNVALYWNIPTSGNGWNSKNWALTVRVGHLYNTTIPEMKGRIYGLKIITRSQGSFMDDINIKVDADNFYSTTGTLTGHWVLTESGQNGRIALPK